MRSTTTFRSHRLSRARLVITITYRDSVVAMVTVGSIGQSRAWWLRTATRRGAGSRGRTTAAASVYRGRALPSKGQLTSG